MRSFIYFTVTLSFAILASFQNLHAQDPSPKSPKPPFTISKETTYLTEPLTEDGYVDYVAALNKICSDGVTPKTTQRSSSSRRSGPNTIKEKYRNVYHKMLGSLPCPKKAIIYLLRVNFLIHSYRTKVRISYRQIRSARSQKN